MFDEIFKRWIETGQLTENDIVPLFLEYDQEFLGGKMTAEQVIFFISHFQTNYYPMMCHILKRIGVNRGKQWEEMVDKNGNVMCRFFVNTSEQI